MSDTDQLRRAAIIGVALAVIVSVPANAAFFAAFGWDIEAAILGDPDAILGHVPSRAALLRWGAIGDMFYSYLLLVPLALFIHRRLRPNGAWLADVGLAGASAYILLGGAGAAILGIAGSSLVEAYSTAAPADRAAIATSFEMVRNVVFFALWQMLDAITVGTWILTTGLLLLAERPVVARLLVVLGAAIASGSALTMLGIHSAAALAVGLVGVFGIWAAWLLVDRARRTPA